MASITSFGINLWPFDLVKLLNYYTLIFRQEGGSIDLYEAYCGTDDVWVGTKCIDNLTPFEETQNYPIALDVADFDWFYAFTYSYMASGTLTTVCYQRKPGLASGTSALMTLPTDACPKFLSCCNFNGQPLIGGIVSTDPVWTQLGKCSVAWGAIGQWEFRPSANRTAGFRRMPWADWDQGVVWKVAKLGNRVVVYGNGGRAVMEPFTKEMVTGWGLTEYDGPGVPNGLQIACGDMRHCYVDAHNEVWLVQQGTDWGKNIEFKKLGYKEFMDQIEGQIVVSHDSIQQRFYISGPNRCYILTEYGLYESHQMTSGVGRYRGKSLMGFVRDNGDYEGRLLGDTIDVRLRSMKTLEAVEFGADSGSNMSGGVDFKYEYSKNKEYRIGSWVRANYEGVIYPGITAPDLRLKFKVEDYRDGVQLDNIVMRWKLSDKRSIRGLYNANKARE